MTAALFLAFVASVALGVILLAAARLPTREAALVAGGLAIWLVFVGALSRSGMIADPTRRPPATLFIFGPLVLFIVLAIIRSAAAGRVARAVPLWLLIGVQFYRVGVEVFLHQLWHEGLVPQMLTFEGSNVDIWIGASAPIIAWLSTRGRGGEHVALVWSVLGLFALANVVARSILTAPGPLHLLDVEVANRAIGTYPYTFIAGFLAPLAVTLHVLALRAIKARRATPAALEATPA